MKFNKTDVIRALETERLGSGEFVVDDTANCKVCAVGAIFRQKGFDNEKIHRIGNKLMNSGRVTPRRCDGPSMNSKRYLKEASLGALYELSNKRCLNAISIMFEAYSEVYRTDKAIRNNTIKWVKANIPNTFSQKV